MSMGGLIFRVTRIHPISGLIYEVVGRTRLNRSKGSGEEDSA
jgi:hypothetical protein